MCSRGRNVERGITRSVQYSLMADSWRQVEEAATKIGACLEPSMGGAEPSWSVRHTGTVVSERVHAGA